MNTDLIAYYKDRANEYEKIYLKPERQDDLAKATLILQTRLAGKNVIEIACGTGFWTERIAQTASSVDATDLNEAVLEIAARKNYGKCNVTFKVLDVFKNPCDKQYDSVLGCFIWSHIPLQQIDIFLKALNDSVGPGGLVILMDNNYVPGSNTPVAQTDQIGNTFQLRRLEDGTEHLILKNFPTEAFLIEKLKDKVSQFELINLKHFWLLTYNTPSDEDSL
jgi:demethylmenaquinone methyltransferase/2-methoxy-6-polyprenyl-1,4-benzoquinol methylase